MTEGDQEKINLEMSRQGRILTDKFDSASREHSDLAAWLYIWKDDAVAAIDKLYEFVDARSQGDGSKLLWSILTSETPIIPTEQVEQASLQWLQQSGHSAEQYMTLFWALWAHNPEKRLLPNVLDWYVQNLKTLGQIPNPYPHAAWPRFLETVQELAKE